MRLCVVLVALWCLGGCARLTVCDVVLTGNGGETLCVSE